MINGSDQSSPSRHAQSDIYFGKWKMTNMYLRIGSPSRQWLRLWLDRGPCCIHCIVAIAGFIVERRHVVPQNNRCEQWAGRCPNLTSRRNRDSSPKMCISKTLLLLTPKSECNKKASGKWPDWSSGLPLFRQQTTYYIVELTSEIIVLIYSISSLVFGNMWVFHDLAL